MEIGEDECTVSRPGRFTPKKSVAGTHSIGGWVGPRACLDDFMKRIISYPCRESNHETPVVQPAPWTSQPLYYRSSPMMALQM